MLRRAWSGYTRRPHRGVPTNPMNDEETQTQTQAADTSEAQSKHRSETKKEDEDPNAGVSQAILHALPELPIAQKRMASTFERLLNKLDHVTPGGFYDSKGNLVNIEDACNEVIQTYLRERKRVGSLY